MPTPAQVFLRQADGAAIGPFPMTALEVLFDARIVDERTPISPDGHGYAALGDSVEIMQHLLTVKEALNRGEDPWPERLADAVVDLNVPDDRALRNLISALVNHSGRQSTGALVFETDEGDIRVSLRDGKVVAVNTSVPELVLSEYLLDAGLVDESALATAEANTMAIGGDFGAALVSQGLIAPHDYFEALVGWAKWVLSQAASDQYGTPSFEPRDEANPSVPLGFDRFGLPVEIVRETFDLGQLRRRLMGYKRCPVIISQVEGVALDECKLQPKELRVLNRVNGVRTLGDLLTELGGTDDKDTAVLKALCFGERAGFIVFGEDLAGAKERAEARALEERYQQMLAKTDFEILGIDEKVSDDDVRTRFTDLAKLYHPDKISAEADPKLLEVRQQLFALISSAFERQETEKQRYEYAHQLETGSVSGENDAVVVQNTFKAEHLFERVKVYVRKRAYDEALQTIDEAIELAPQEIEFQIERQYIWYLASARSGDVEVLAKETIANVKRLLKQDANIASGYLILGHLYKSLNNADLSLKYYEKVLEIVDDPTARSEVRIAYRRKERELRKKNKRWL